MVRTQRAGGTQTRRPCLPTGHRGIDSSCAGAVPVVRRWAQHLVTRTRIGDREGMPTDMLVDVAGITILVKAWPADGPHGRAPVMLLPATGETAEDWDVVASVLRSSRDVYAINLRGHCGSSWPGTYSIQLMADDVAGLLDAVLARQPVDLVGHSLGGLVACSIAASRPELVHRLVLEDVGLLKPRPPALPPRPAGELEFDWRMVEQVRPEIDAFDPRWSDVIGSIAARTLVIGGGAESPIPQEYVAALARRLEDGRMVTVEAGHLVHATMPEQFTEHLLSFLDS